MQLIDDARTLVKAVRGSANLSGRLRKIQKARGWKCLSPILDVATRWLSLHAMLKRFVEMADHWTFLALTGDLDSTGVKADVLLPRHMATLKDVVKALDPVADFVRLGEGDRYTTLSMIPVLYLRCLKATEVAHTDHTALREFKSVLKSHLQFRLDYLVNDVNLALAAAALDPDFGHLQFVGPAVRQLVCISAAPRMLTSNI